MRDCFGYGKGVFFSIGLTIDQNSDTVLNEIHSEEFHLVNLFFTVLLVDVTG